MAMYKKTLVANRGEIALRIIKALKELGVETVAVYSRADKDMPYTKMADHSICIGNSNASDSYLNTYKILSAATITKCDSIHPGIGFLAENDRFAKLCSQVGIDFIGPDSNHIYLMGNKSKAKEIAQECGLPIIKGGHEIINSADDCKNIATVIGYPVILKAVYGGGGKGIRVIESADDIKNGLELCKKEAKLAFNNCDIIVEKYLENMRHVEVQIIGDKYGNVIHLGDRECTIQRSKQKIIEEAPCLNINSETRKRLHVDAIKLAKHIGYVGPGTVEFIVLSDGSYFFLEMNTRLQVEHTITELVTGVDIVKEQIRVCSGENLSIYQSDVNINGYAIQGRVLAEAVKDGFRPSFGKIINWHMPGGPGVRVDGGYSAGTTVSPYYDSLLAKICCYDQTKELAVKKMCLALREIEIKGINHNIAILKYIVNDTKFLNGDYNERYFDQLIKEYNSELFE